MESPLNRLLNDLSEVLERNRTGEKWIMAPSLRTGFQWLDRLAWHGVPVLNARVKTFPALALELCSPEMEKQGLSYLRGLSAEVLADKIIAGFYTEGGYVLGLERTPGLVRTVLKGIFDLRLAGLFAKRLSDRDFEVKNKGGEIKRLLAAYEKELEENSLLDYAGVLRLAVSLLQESPGLVPEEVETIAPSDLLEGLSPLERELWESFPESSRLSVKPDIPGEARGDNLPDSGLLGFINEPAKSPPPSNDGTASIFRAVGEVNEVREVLRRIVENSIPFDQVEILHTDSETYVPLLYELVSLLIPLGDGSLPATFQEGIPSRYSRPARALQGWISWLREGHQQSVLTRMIGDGLLNSPAEEEESPVYSRLAALFRSVPIGGGRDRYLRILDKEISSLEKAPRRRSDDEPEDPEKEQRRRRRKKELVSLRELVASLLELAGPASGPQELLKRTETFLTDHARSVNQLDEYSRRLLLRFVRELSDCLSEGLPGRDILEWLSEFSQGAMVGGLGPRPGCLFVAPLSSGGHSGRPYTYIVGLDESRFPGSGLQDPLLLDKERNNISGGLPTSQSRTELKLLGFARLLSRLRGHVTFSYSCRSLEDDRDMFPSTAVMSAFRILSGNKDGVLEDLEGWMPRPVSFAPEHDKRCIDPTEWWLHRMCGDVAVKDPESIIAKHFPHLGQGFKARAARQSNRFTEYDGYVPAAGTRLDPRTEEGTVLSSSKLETLGKLPLNFFFKYVLKIEPPEEYGMDPEVWLDPLEKGTLLHEVFRRFMAELLEAGETPCRQEHSKRLMEIVEQEVDRAAEDNPPPGPDVFERDRQLFLLAAWIFLLEEETHCRESQPVYLEACIGMDTDNQPVEMDTPYPALLHLPDGSTVRVIGRLDRVDRLADEDNKYAVWDYKTGNYNEYKYEDPFKGGRVVQNALYLHLAQARLAEMSPGAKVELFGYFFPGAVLHGERVCWRSSELDGGGEVIQNLCELMAAGCFPVSESQEDYKRSHYLDAITDDEKASIEKKLQNPENGMLRPFLRLRGLEDNDEQ